MTRSTDPHVDTFGALLGVLFLLELLDDVRLEFEYILADTHVEYIIDPGPQMSGIQLRQANGTLAEIAIDAQGDLIVLLGQGPAKDYYYLLERSIAPYLYDDVRGQAAWETMLDLLWRLNVIE